MTFTSEPILSVREASILQGEHEVLQNINFEVNKGEFVYVIGKTGSGKSSLMKTLYADLELYRGDIKVAGYQLLNITRKQTPFLRRKIGIVFQDFQLLMDRSIAENLLFAMKATGWADRSKMKQRLAEVLMKVGLGASENKMPHQLSGGEQQRIAIARALINEPSILFADEPTGNLDPKVGDDILTLFQSINNSGTAILMATHNHNFLEKYPARILKCENGKVWDSTKESFTYSDNY